jgi:hypothetical protein
MRLALAPVHCSAEQRAPVLSRPLRTRGPLALRLGSLRFRRTVHYNIFAFDSVTDILTKLRFLGRHTYGVFQILLLT